MLFILEFIYYYSFFTFVCVLNQFLLFQTGRDAVNIGLDFLFKPTFNRNLKERYSETDFQKVVSVASYSELDSEQNS